MPAFSGNSFRAFSTLIPCAGAHLSMNERRVLNPWATPVQSLSQPRRVLTTAHRRRAYPWARLQQVDITPRLGQRFSHPRSRPVHPRSRPVQFSYASVQFSYASIPYLTPPRQVVDREWTGSFKGECRESSYVQEI